MSAIDDGKKALSWWLEEDTYFTGCLGNSTIVHIAQEVLEERRWYAQTLDIYETSSSERFGIVFCKPATELQGDGDFDPPYVVEVKAVPSIMYVIAKESK